MNAEIKREEPEVSIWKQRITRITDKASPARIAVFILLLGLLVIVTGFFYLYEPGQRTIKQFVTDLYANGGAELLSIAITVLVIDGLNQKRATKQELRRLILQMGSPDNTTAIEAVRILTLERWLTDGSLRGAYLFRANLEGANLSSANLQGAGLGGANLQKAILEYVNLEGTDLWFANLEGANLGRANLQGAGLHKANLQGTGLVEANLQGADLRSANLQGARLYKADLQGANLYEANLQEASIDTRSILPDGSKWTKETDMARFTNPGHPYFFDTQQAKDGRWGYIQPIDNG